MSFENESRRDLPRPILVCYLKALKQLVSVYPELKFQTGQKCASILFCYPQ